MAAAGLICSYLYLTHRDLLDIFVIRKGFFFSILIEFFLGLIEIIFCVLHNKRSIFKIALCVTNGLRERETPNDVLGFLILGVCIDDYVLNKRAIKNIKT